MRSTGELLPREVERFLSSESLNHEAVLVAYSGGVDSTALLTVFCELRAAFSLSITAAYFDHGIRSEAERSREITVVTDTSTRLLVDLETEGVEPGRLDVEARAQGTSVEAYARTVRYRFLAAAARRRGARIIVTGHHRGDVIETVLLRLVQGAGIAGLGGIPVRRDVDAGVRVFRPLLNVSKESILEYVRQRDVSWVDDSTNDSVDYDRNRIRHRVVPAVLESFPSAGEAIVRFARRNSAAADYISRQAAVALPWLLTADGYTIPSDRFWRADPVLRIESVLSIMNRLFSVHRVPASMLDVLREPRRDGGIVLHGKGFVLYQLSGSLFLNCGVAHQLESGYLLRVSLPSSPATVETVARVPVETEASAGVCVDRASLSEPLIARSWRSGDDLTSRGVKKSVKRLLPELGVPRMLRNAVPILEDGDGVIAVIGELVGGQTRIADRAQSSVPDPIRITFQGEARNTE